MGKYLYLAVVFILLPVVGFSQSASELEGLLRAGTVSAAVATRFILAAADLLPADISGDDAETVAYDKAAANGWISNKAAGDTAAYKDAAFLIMKAFDLKGGIMYSLFKNPRYAYRELVYKKIIQGWTDPDKPVSGSKLMQIIEFAFVYQQRGSK